MLKKNVCERKKTSSIESRTMEEEWKKGDDKLIVTGNAVFTCAWCTSKT